MKACRPPHREDVGGRDAQQAAVGAAPRQLGGQEARHLLLAITLAALLALLAQALWQRRGGGSVERVRRRGGRRRRRQLPEVDRDRGIELCTALACSK